MRSFHYFSKSVFWSQFLVGLVAMFALPNLESEHLPQQNDASNAQFIASELISYEGVEQEQPYFIALDSPTIPYQCLQAVIFCHFLAKPYRVEQTNLPPIRAGPQSQV